MNLFKFAGLSLIFASLGATGATLSDSNINRRTTLYVMNFSDLTFAGAFNQRSDALQFNGAVGDSGTFGVVGFPPGATISVVPDFGMTVSNIQPANSAGVVFYTTSIVGTSNLNVTQSWINTGTLTTGATAGGLRYLDFFARNSGFLRIGGTFDFNVTIPGNWSSIGTSTGQVQLLGVNPQFSVTQTFVYDTNTNRTTFQAINSNYQQSTSDIHFVLYGAPVPEPASVAMLSLGLITLLLKHRLRRQE